MRGSDARCAMHRFYSNIGLASTLRSQVMVALDNNAAMRLVLEETLRMVTITNTAPADDELVVMCSDTDNGSTIVLYLPYSPNAAAQAHVISYTEGA